jgi:hypothetical protein
MTTLSSWFSWFAGDPLSLASRRVENETHDGKNKEYEEQGFRDSRRAGCDTAKAEYSGNQGYCEEHNGVMQHGGLS